MKEKDDLLKEINQMDKLDKSVDEVMDVMVVIYKSVVDKLEKDRTCSNCGKRIPFKDLILVLSKGSQKGVVSIMSVCKDCYETRNNKK